MPKSRRRSKRDPVATDRRFRHSIPTLADHGAPERWQHSGRALELTEQAGVLAARATEEHIIDRLVLRGWISAVEREAAFKFKLDYQRAALGARVTGRYNAASSARDFFANIYERSDFEEAAYQRWRNALRAAGKRVANILITTVCHDIMPIRSDVAQLQEALKKLADWYGLEDNARGASRLKKTNAKRGFLSPNGGEEAKS